MARRKQLPVALSAKEIQLRLEAPGASGADLARSLKVNRATAHRWIHRGIRRRALAARVREALRELSERAVRTKLRDVVKLAAESEAA